MQLKKVIRHSVSIQKWALLLGLSLVLWASCHNNEKISHEEAQGLPDDFVAFYTKFHTDSVFQMAHITFPLEGYPSGNLADSIKDVADFRWTADKWVMHRPFFNDTTFTRQFESPMPILVNEIIIQKQNGYGTLRRFMKRENEWFLIFYSDMNKLEDRAPAQKPQLKIE